MSGGRDLRAFLSSHRNGTFHTNKSSSTAADTLGRKYSVGSAPKIQSVDYEQVLSNIQQHKDNVVTGLERFKSLTKKGKQAKEVLLLRKHHEIWNQENTRLFESCSRAQSELNQWRGDMLAKGYPCLKELLTELTAFESELHDSQQEFKQRTLTPVWCVRADLKGLVKDTASGPLGKPHLSPLEQIIAELETVKEQQNIIQQLLQEEFESMESDLDNFMDDWGVCNHGNVLVVKDTEPVVQVLPSAVLDLQCPDEKFVSNALNEFCSLDNQFTTLLAEWREANQHTLTSPYGGWSRCEAESFHHLLQQHPLTLANRRRLYMDRATRQFPHKTRDEIVAHESWHLSLKHYVATRRDLLTAWAGHRDELAVRMVEVCREVCHTHQAAAVARTQRNQWRQRCDKLYNKVQAWREEKMKLQQAETERIAKQRAIEEEQRQREEQRASRKREQEKTQIKQYQSTLQSCHRDNLEQVRRLEEAAKIEKTKLAAHNVERVGFRQEILLQKAIEARELKELALKEAKEKEKRLDLLRQQVQVETTFDPERVVQATISSQARVASLTAPPDSTSGLYKLHGYISDKITSDPRVRLECALREAGLHTTPYARAALARIPPPQQPRPDQTSTLFKNNTN